MKLIQTEELVNLKLKIKKDLQYSSNKSNKQNSNLSINRDGISNSTDSTQTFWRSNFKHHFELLTLIKSTGKFGLEIKPTSSQAWINICVASLYKGTRALAIFSRLQGLTALLSVKKDK